jgi:hypothetical protein
MLPPSSRPSNEILRLMASIDEFKGEWRAVETIKPERLQSFRREATVAEAPAATDADRNTIKDKFTELIGQGLAELHGKGRGTLPVWGFLIAYLWFS